MSTNKSHKSQQATVRPVGRDNRSASNLLIYREFQLKYVWLLVGLTIAISAPLGALLYQQATATLQVATEANDAARDAVEQARQLNTRLAFEALITARGDAAKVEKATKENEAATAGIDARAKALASQAGTLGKQRSILVSTLGAALGLLVVLVGILGVYVTHRVAGPIHRMRELFKQVGDGAFPPGVAPLRKSDELQEFFSEFAQMIKRLHDRQQEDLARLDDAIKVAEENGTDKSSVANLRVARDAILARSVPPPANK